MKNKILVLDIETTGFQNEGGLIVEIGAVEMDVQTWEINEVFSSLCREPGLTAKHRDSWIFKNSDLTVEALRQAPPFEEVAAAFQLIVNQYTNGATAFNRVFDINFLHSRGLTFPKLLPCPMLLSTDICKLPGKFDKYKWPSVMEAYAYFFPDIPYNEKHRGADDARHEAMIVAQLIQLGFYKDLQALRATK